MKTDETLKMEKLNDTARDNVLMQHMGEDFERLSPLLQHAHTGRKALVGTANVERGNFLARLICAVFRFPKENRQSPLSVKCIHSANTMDWYRDFNGLKMTSHFQKEGKFLVEKLGSLKMYFHAEQIAGGLHYRFVKTKFLGVPMPDFLSPQVEAYEKELDGKYHFSVAVRMFAIGPVISYGGGLDVSELTE